MPHILKQRQITLLIVGECWNGEKGIKEKIEGLGLNDSVKLVTRYVPNEEVADYFAASDLIALPYKSATGSAIVQTAFALETPVAATNVGCLPEVVSHGKTGFLVEPQNPIALADAVIRYYQENRGEEFRRNIRRENRRFSWDIMVETIERMCLNGSKGSASL